MHTKAIIPIENCSFISLSSIIALIKNEETQEIFKRELEEEGFFCGERSKHTLVAIECIAMFIEESIEIADENKNDYKEALATVNNVRMAGVKFVDLEN